MSLDKLVIATADIALEIGVRGGVWLNRIADLRAQREWLGAPTSLFAFKVHGKWYDSGRHLVVDHASESSVRAHAPGQPIAFELSFAASEQVVGIDLVVTNQAPSPLTIALVAPRIRGLVPPIDASGFVGCVPQEAAGVADLTPRQSHLEVTDARDGGLEVAVIRSDSRIVFSRGIAHHPWQDDVDGNMVADAFRAIPRSAFAAVRRNLVQFDTFYVDRHGRLWTAWRLGHGPTAVINVAELSQANFAEPGASLAAVQRTESDIDLFVIGRDRKLWRLSERNNGAWSPPEEMPSPGRWLASGAPVAAVRHVNDLVDVFFADAQGDLWVAHQTGWTPGRAPVWQLQNITRQGAGPVPVNGHLRAVAHPDGGRVDVFFVGRGGGFYSASSLPDGKFAPPVLRSSSMNFARPGTKIAAAWRNSIQLDAFVLGDNAVTTLYAVNATWRSASISLPQDMPRFVAEGAGLAVHKRAAGDDTQLDLFVVAEDGKVWSNFVIGGGAWKGWFPVFEAFVPLGMPVNPSRDLPGAMNSLEVASVTDRRLGGGIFVADLEGDVERERLPIQFCLSAAELGGHWRADLDGNASAAMPRFAIGVHPTGDWRNAIDFVRGVRPPAGVDPPTPAWLREAGAIYASSGGGYGGIYLAPEFESSDLRDRLAELFAWPGASFQSLPFLHKQARDLGTDVLYLADYWEPATSAPPPDYDDKERSPYWNKGDYLPRQDLGGETAFIEGIRAVHNAGGRVILYVEPFILFARSQVFQALPALDNDEKDGAHRFEPGFDANTAPDFLPYGAHYRRPPPFYLPWQDHVVSVCERLARYGADGIFLDSWAWQMNIALCIRGRGAKPVKFTCFSMTQWNRGVLALTRRVRAAIRKINPDAVVIGETNAGPIARVWDGGLSMDFTYAARDANRARMAASPIRYYTPGATWFTNGTTLNELYQVFAAGHSLALAGGATEKQAEFLFWNRDMVRRLVQLRRELKDALVYGRLVDLPDTGNAQTIAYLYSGRSTLVLTIVNVTDEDYYGAARSESFARHPTWTDALDPTKPPVTANPDLLIYVPAKGIRVFRAPRNLLPFLRASDSDRLEAVP